jgi:hypothetical protein
MADEDSGIEFWRIDAGLTEFFRYRAPRAGDSESVRPIML